MVSSEGRGEQAVKAVKADKADKADKAVHNLPSRRAASGADGSPPAFGFTASRR
jgi:hypothetical protein